jgi:hypothetical protein
MRRETKGKEKRDRKERKGPRGNSREADTSWKVVG